MRSPKNTHFPVKRLALAALIALAAVPASAEAATRYAAPDGDGPAATCPASDPCALQTAVEDPAVNNGDEVVVTDGDYTIFDPLRIEKAITVRGPEPGVRPRIVGAGANRFEAVVGGAVLRDLDLAHYGGDIGLYATNGALIERVNAYSESNYTCSVQAVTIRDSVCVNEKHLGRALRMSLSGAPGTTRLRHVTAVARNTMSYGIEVETVDATINLDARSVIASGVNGDVAVNTFNAAGNATATFENSNYLTTSTSGPGAESLTQAGTGSNQTEEPAFVSPAAVDYRQLEGSPTIDKGATDGFSGALDLDGEERTMGDAPDIGADEYTVAEPPPPPPPPPPEDPEDPEDPEADKQAPETTITTAPKRKVKMKKARATVTLSYAASEAGSKFECSLDGAPFSSCSDTYTAKVKKGKHSFRVRAIDAAGNVDGSPAEALWKVKRKRR